MIWIVQPRCGLFLIAGILAAASSALAQSTVTTYQGRLTSGGGPEGGSHNFVFRLCSSAGPGGVLQTFPPAGTVAVTVTNGLFTQELTFDTTHFNGAERWLEIEVDGTTLSPRQHLTYAPYANFALNAGQLDGLDSTAFLQSIPVPLTLSGANPGSHIIRGENASTGSSSVGVYGRSTAASGATTGVYGRSDSSSGYGVFGEAPAASGINIGGRFRSLSTGGTGVFGEATATSGTTYGGYFQNASTSGIGVRGWATATSGVTDGGRFESNSTSGRGVFGLATAASGTTYGGRFESASTSGIGVRGIASATSGSCYGGYFESASPLGRGVVGLASATSASGSMGGYFVSASTGGFGVLAEATGGTGETYGMYARSDSTGGRGVYGLASANSGTTYGGYFHANSTSGRGVFGYASATSGTTYGGRFESDSPGGRGVYGYASASGASDTPYGVRGQCSTATLGYGVYALGDMGASGTKPFRIDHPDDPQNKYLLHYAAESPEVINFYRGTVVLDNAGEAVVELPPYFAKINKTPSYQLTAVGAPMPMLHVAAKISEDTLTVGANFKPGQATPVCSFRIAGGVPGGEVSWRVEAVRNDPWVRSRAVPTRTVQGGRSIDTRAMPVEVEKQGVEKGKYQHPEHYGQPREKGMDHHEVHQKS